MVVDNLLLHDHAGMVVLGCSGSESSLMLHASALGHSTSAQSFARVYITQPKSCDSEVVFHSRRVWCRGASDLAPERLPYSEVQAQGEISG